LRAAVRANPRSTTFVALVHRLCDSGRAAEAEDICREGLAQHPGLVTGQVALGRALLDRGRLREAQDVLIAAAQANPDHGDAFRFLGETVIKRGDLPRARALLEYAEELSPSDRRVMELMVEAGGTPVFRPPRPRTDFEHTRVANARPLADRMHEQPDALEVTRVGPTSLANAHAKANSNANSSVDFEDRTVVDRTAASKAWAAVRRTDAGSGPGVPDAADSSPLRAPSAPPGPLFESPSDENIVWPSDDEPAQRAAPARMPSRPLPTLGGVGMMDGRHTVSALLPVVPGMRRVRLAIGAVVAALLAGAAAALLVGNLRVGPPARVSEAFSPEVSRGTLASLLKARDLDRELLVRRPADADGRAALAFADALLTRDYGLPYRQEAEEALGMMGVKASGPSARIAVAHAARTLLALGAGDLAEAQRQADAALAQAPDGTAALLAAARVRAQMADLSGARSHLERLLSRVPDFGPAVLDWSAVWIDLGDPSAAAQSLRAQLARTPDHTRLRLLLGEAERALGEKTDDPTLAAACRTETKQSPTIRAGCALAAAAEARLAGDRATAIKTARAAAAEAPDDPRLLASAALTLAVLGEVDAGSEALGRAQRLARLQTPALLWADLALRLGRRQPIPDQPVLPGAAGPERRLVAARLALAHGGTAELGVATRALPVALVLFDPDLRALAFLGRNGAGPRAERAEIERRADHGDPMAAYVLGRLAERTLDSRQAVRRLERALAFHGDACDAAARLRGLRPSDSSSWSRAMRELRARNSQCEPARM
jgi:tetratricopeptide (TPR) repeat protein